MCLEKGDADSTELRPVLASRNLREVFSMPNMCRGEHVERSKRAARFASRAERPSVTLERTRQHVELTKRRAVGEARGASVPLGRRRQHEHRCEHAERDAVRRAARFERPALCRAREPCVVPRGNLVGPEAHD